MRFVDLFAGLGGFHLAARSLGGRCVFASEIDVELQRLYEANLGIRPAGDIRQVAAEDIPAHDLLCAGFPCQPFSKAGEQAGWDDPVRGTLFDDVLRVLRHHRPGMVLIENVAHFVRHDMGRTFQRVEAALRGLGYDVASHQLSPHRHGVPQVRERMYMVGSLTGLGGFSWPAPETHADDLSVSMVLDRDPPDAVPIPSHYVRCLETWQRFLDLYPASDELPSWPIWSMEFGADYPYDRGPLSEMPIDALTAHRGAFGAQIAGATMDAALSMVPSHARRTGDSFPAWKRNFLRHNRELYSRHRAWLERWIPDIAALPPSLQKLEWNCKGDERNIWSHVVQFRASGVRVKKPTTAPSLVAMTTTQVPIIAWERRFMTIRECARLQSMDALQHLPSQPSAAVTALGNAVNVRVATLVLRALLGACGQQAPSQQASERPEPHPTCVRAMTSLCTAAGSLVK